MLSTIFREVMENMELWYMGHTLEVDYYRLQALGAQGRKMKHDPRTNKPFEQMDVTGVSEGSGSDLLFVCWRGVFFFLVLFNAVNSSVK